MTSSTSHSVFRNAALASGLLSQQQLDDALAGLAKEAASAGNSTATESLSDELLGQRLVDLGYLNRWQVEQLKEGRTKFTLGPYRDRECDRPGRHGARVQSRAQAAGTHRSDQGFAEDQEHAGSGRGVSARDSAQAQLDHPNLVRVTYADYEGDTYFFVTEYVPGTDLRKLVRRNGPLPYPIAATIISQAAEGLHYAHRRGLVHRDVKPGNLLVTPDGRTKITDLGSGVVFDGRARKR